MRYCSFAGRFVLLRRPANLRRVTVDKDNCSCVTICPCVLLWRVWVHYDWNKVLNPMQFFVPSFDQGFCSSVSCFADTTPICATWKQRYLVSYSLLIPSATCATPVLHLRHCLLRSVVDQVLTGQWAQIAGVQEAPEYSLIALIVFTFPAVLESQTALLQHMGL